jgi:hypothetical protein
MIPVRTYKLLAVAALAGASFLGVPRCARADFDVQFTFGTAVITVDGTTHTASGTGGASPAGATITYGPGSITIQNLTVSTTATTGGFLIQALSVTSGSPDGSTGLHFSGGAFLNQTGVAGTSMLQMTVGDTGFNSPSGNPVTLTSDSSATADRANSASAQLAFTSYLDNTNTQFGTQQSSPPVSLNLPPGVSGSGNSFPSVNASTTAYSLTDKTSITLVNLDAFQGIIGDTKVSAPSAAPAPAGIVLALSGLPLLANGLLRQRRKTANT